MNTIAVPTMYMVCGVRMQFTAHINAIVDGKKVMYQWLTPWAALIQEVMIRLNKRGNEIELNKIKKVFSILIRINPKTHQEELFVTVDTRYTVKDGIRIDKNHNKYEISFTGGGRETCGNNAETVYETAIAEVSEETGVPITKTDILNRGPAVNINNDSIAMLWLVTDEYGMKLERISGIAKRNMIKMGNKLLYEVPEQHARAWVPVSELMSQSQSNGNLSICTNAPTIRQRKVMLDFLKILDANIVPIGVLNPLALSNDIKRNMNGTANILQRLNINSYEPGLG